MSLMKKSIEYIIFSFISLTALTLVTIKFWNPLKPEDYFIILIYLFLLVFVNSFPLKISDIYVSFLLAISISVFLEYGLIVEMWLTQLSILISMLISAQRRNIYRIFLSQMMFIWISIFAGFSFFLVGGEIGFTVSSVREQMIPIFVYTITYFLSNSILLYFIRRGIEQENISLITEDMFWDAGTLLLTLPLGVIMYLVKIQYGLYGMLIVAIPILIVTHLFKIYSELHHSHNQLKALNKISSSFTSELNLEKTISAIQSATRELLKFDYSYILLVNGDKLKMCSVEDSDGNAIDIKELENISILIGEGLSGKVALYKKAEIIGTDADLFQLEVEPEFIKNNKSLLSVPMIWHNQVLGVITLGSSSEYYFSKKDLTIVRILASQAAVAIQNATRYQKSEEKSLMDELTGIYNYRAFDEMLREMTYEAEIKEEKLSLLMIDLDHFKQINDKYGHSAGNVVLKEIAQLLKEFTRREDVVSRYGGEEFTILIPNADINKAQSIAERIRYAIENYAIKVKNSIDNNEELVVKVTASIGVATFPDMAESAQDIVRHADRAMYIGSKQSGRNKVSVYEAS